MSSLIQQLGIRYWFRVLLTVLFCISTVWFGIHQSYGWLGVSLCLLVLSIIWQIRLYQLHTKQVLFMINALENNDNTFHFPEENGTPESQKINRALNRVGHILYNVKAETAQQEKYYELILDFVSTGLLVLNDNGAVYQKNKEALRLLGLNIFTHIHQLSKVDTTLMEKIENCRPGDKLQVIFHNERGTVNLSIRVSEINVRKEHLRILALNDINTELDEKEIDSWIRLTRVLTHEIMNTIAPIISLSQTLASYPEISEKGIRGLHIIQAQSERLMEFTESFRHLSYLPQPEKRLFSLSDLLHNLEELLQTNFQENNISFTLRCSPEPMMTEGDEKQLSQVFLNLLKNAMQALEGHPHGELSLQAEQDEYIVIDITDNGPGIPPEIMDKVFIPFFTTKSEGTGIGLSLCKEIIRCHEGHLAIKESRAGKTVFHIELP